MTTQTEEHLDPQWVARRNFQREVAELSAFYAGRLPVRWKRYLDDLLAADVDESPTASRFVPRGAVEVRAALWGFVLASVLFTGGLVIALGGL